MFLTTIHILMTCNLNLPKVLESDTHLLLDIPIWMSHRHCIFSMATVALRMSFLLPHSSLFPVWWQWPKPSLTPSPPSPPTSHQSPCPAKFAEKAHDLVPSFSSYCHHPVFNLCNFCPRLSQYPYHWSPCLQACLLEIYLKCEFDYAIGMHENLQLIPHT